MKVEDKIRIQHMIDAAKEALHFIDDISKDDFIKNRMLILSCVKDIEIIGEAASKITNETKAEHSDIPWKDIVGMRNRLIQGYFDIDVDIVWNTVNMNLPNLLNSLEKLLDKTKN